MSQKRRKRRREERDRRRNAGDDEAGTARAQARRSEEPPPIPHPATVLAASPIQRIEADEPAPSGAHVVIALASTGDVHEQTLGSIQKMLRATRRAASLELWWHNAYPGGHCRNKLVERFLADKSKTHLLFVDTDMGVPQRGLDLLLETGEPLVCGPAPICPRRETTARTEARGSVFELTTNVMDISDPALRGKPTAPDDPHIEYVRREHGTYPDEPFHCDVSGMSFCLIAREVVERMTPPWYYFVDLPSRKTIGVDVYFFRKAGELGYRLVVHPGAMCDHVKPADLTRFEQLLIARPPEPRWNWQPIFPTPPTMVIVCTRNHWIEFKTAELMLRWQEDPNLRVAVQVFEADTAARALGRFLHHPAAADPQWERLLLINPEVVPSFDVIEKLASIDAPIISTMNRTVINGDIVFSFAVRDATTGKLDYPGQIPAGEATQPFEVHTVDLACAMIKRETCKHVPDALRSSADQADPDRAFGDRFVELIREETGRNPVVAPLLVERRADMGLLSLLELKHKLQTDERSRPVQPEPVSV